jgi:hypothetical protein
MGQPIELGNGYTLVRSSKSGKISDDDYIGYDKDGDGLFDAVLVSTTKLPEKLIDDLEIDHRFSIRHCSTNILKSLLTGNSHLRKGLMEINQTQGKLYQLHISAGRKPFGNLLAASQTCRGLSKARDKNWDSMEQKFYEQIEHAKDVAQNTCVPLQRDICEAYNTVINVYTGLARCIVNEGEKRMTEVSDLQKRAATAIEKAKKYCSEEPSEEEVDIHLRGALICAVHINEDCMNQYLDLACETHPTCNEFGWYGSRHYAAKTTEVLHTFRTMRKFWDMFGVER